MYVCIIIIIMLLLLSPPWLNPPFASSRGRTGVAAMAGAGAAIGKWTAGLRKAFHICHILPFQPSEIQNLSREIGRVCKKSRSGFRPSSADLSCHILPFQPILGDKYFPPEPANTAKRSPKSISEGGRIWQVCFRHRLKGCLARRVPSLSLAGSF